MKKLYIVFGGSVGHYHNWFKVTYKIEKVLGIKLRRVSAEVFEGEKDNIPLKIMFCWNPIRDKNYYSMKEYAEREFKEIVSPPAEEIVKKIINPSAVLFLGLCGSFKGKKDDVFIPEEFKEIIFKEEFVRKKDILKISPKNSIKLDNFMKGKIEGKSAKAITSNLTLMPRNMENESKDILIKLTRSLIKSGDLVEKESYQIVKGMKGKCPVGVVLISSDVLTIKKHMLNPHKFFPNKEKIRKVFSKAVKEMIEAEQTGEFMRR